MRPAGGRRQGAWRLRLLAVSCLLLLAGLAWALSVTDLRPVADGAVEGWTNTAASACSTGGIECWQDVDDASGATCTTAASDGDTTFNSSGTTSGTVQQWDLDESGIPDGATVTDGVVRICGRKDGGAGTTVTTVLSICINGSCTDGATVAPGASYGDFSSGTIDFADDVKSAADDYEIKARNTQARSVRVSAIEADLTYVLPAAGGQQRVIITLRARGAKHGQDI